MTMLFFLSVGAVISPLTFNAKESAPKFPAYQTSINSESALQEFKS